ncbi:MAG: chemotaxis protein CheW [Thermodesulfobacteriota bacterium]|nr:chemotaxis protein CheW [Thermodesulfobacteriota bacterium]
MSSPEIEVTKLRQFVSFRIDEYLMGIDILKVREINMLLNITPVQHAPDFVRGLINLRGQTVVVFDLGVIMERSVRIMTDQSHNIILKADDVGLLVDSIGEVIDVFNDEIEILPANMDAATGKYAESVVKLDNELMIIISTEKILENQGRK